MDDKFLTLNNKWISKARKVLADLRADRETIAQRLEAAELEMEAVSQEKNNLAQKVFARQESKSEPDYKRARAKFDEKMDELDALRREMTRIDEDLIIAEATLQRRLQMEARRRASAHRTEQDERLERINHALSAAFKVIADYREFTRQRHVFAAAYLGNGVVDTLNWSRRMVDVQQLIQAYANVLKIPLADIHLPASKAHEVLAGQEWLEIHEANLSALQTLEVEATAEQRSAQEAEHQLNGWRHRLGDIVKTFESGTIQSKDELSALEAERSQLEASIAEAEQRQQAERAHAQALKAVEVELSEV